jgi:hypothetical protein
VAGVSVGCYGCLFDAGCVPGEGATTECTAYCNEQYYSCYCACLIGDMACHNACLSSAGVNCQRCIGVALECASEKCRPACPPGDAGQWIADPGPPAPG